METAGRLLKPFRLLVMVHPEICNKQHGCTGVRVAAKPEFNGNIISLKLPVLSNGIHFLNVYVGGIKHSVKILIVQ
jgi:hypothetical protein